MTIGIVVALPEELSTVSPVKLARGEVFSSQPHIKICLSGAGHNNARLAAQKLLEQGATQLISWGCAAALAPHLKSGDLIITSQVIAKGQSIENTHQWAEQISGLLGVKQSLSGHALASNYGLISSSIEKQGLYTEIAAVALDMESAAVASIAHEAHCPFVAIRAIADPAAMSLPPAILKALNPEGEVVLGILLKHLLSHPWEIPALIKLGWHFNAAQKTLRGVAKQLEQMY